MNKIDLAKLLHQWTIEVLDTFGKTVELGTPREWKDLDALNRTVLVRVAKKVINEFKKTQIPPHTILRYRSS